MKKILIVEDEQLTVKILENQFKKAGFEVVLAVDVAEATTLTKGEKPDIILLDIRLPEESGLVFLERMRKDPETSSIPVVAFSNFDDSEAKEQAKKLGAIAFLLKTDYTPTEIVEKVKEYL